MSQNPYAKEYIILYITPTAWSDNMLRTQFFRHSKSESKSDAKDSSVSDQAAGRYGSHLEREEFAGKTP